ncbi:MAG: FkbM family methyltransferase [Acutalibacteraceae bacterium]
MLEKIKEENIWDFLSRTDKPIILYGMGNGADMIIDALESFSISFTDIFASDNFVRGHSFHGVRVKKFSEIKELYDDFIILVTFAVHDKNTMDYIRQLSREYTLFSPTVPVADNGLFTLDYIREHEKEFDEAYEMLADEKSKNDFIDILSFKVSGKIEYLFHCQSEKEELYRTVFPLSENETIVDLGAYDGDTIREFLSYTGGKYEKIYAFEPDPKNFIKLKNKTQGLENIEIFNIGAWDKKETLFFEKKAGRNSRRGESGTAQEFDAVDNVINEKVTFIKMDIEGSESRALDGAKGMIEKYKPKLYVCAYHRKEDMFHLPLKIKSFCPGYKIYFRHHPYIPAWESNFYAVAEK